MIKEYLFLFWKKVISQNKYLIVLIIFALWVIFFDKNNLIDRFEYINQKQELEEKKEYYKDKIEQDSAKLYKLRHNTEYLERYAREKYYMKRPDEEIFVITKDSVAKKSRR